MPIPVVYEVVPGKEPSIIRDGVEIPLRLTFDQGSLYSLSPVYDWHFFNSRLQGKIGMFVPRLGTDGRVYGLYHLMPTMVVLN
jgi:hypothetical protein